MPQAPSNISPTTKAKSIKIEHLNAWYGHQQALRDVSLDIFPARITAIIGPSGCGKSTLIRCINRMHEVVPGSRAEGNIYVGGQNVNDPDVDPVAVRRLVGMVFQKPNPFPTMSVFDNVVAGLRLVGERDRRKLTEIVEISLRRAALWNEVKDKLHEPGMALSGGQQQRLCIARALAVGPEVLLMDEPCSALDPIATLRIEDLIGELSQEITIVIVTHNMQQAARVSHYTAFMLSGEERIGELIEYGDTGKLFTNPADRRTEDYVTGRFG